MPTLDLRNKPHKLGRKSIEVKQCLHDFFQIIRVEVIIKGQPQQAVAQVFGDRAVARAAAKLTAHLGEVQGQVVEDRQDAAAFEVGDQGLAGDQ